MRRLLAIAVLSLGILPSIPVFEATATIPSQEQLTLHCRIRLGHTANEPLVGSDVFQLRRCVTNVRKQYERVEQFERRLQRYDQQFWLRFEHGQKVLRESQRSLDVRMQQQQNTRIQYYKTTSLQERAEELDAHRRSRRTVVREREQQLLRERRTKQERWQNALRSCRYYDREEREKCVQYMLTQ